MTYLKRVYEAPFLEWAGGLPLAQASKQEEGGLSVTRLTPLPESSKRPPSQVNDSKKGSNGPAGSRSGKLHSEERDGLSVTGRSPASPESNEGPPG